MSLSKIVSNPETGAFLSKNNIATLATVDATGCPRASVIYFVIDPQLNVYFITKRDTAKAKNIKLNNNVSLAVYEPKSQTTAQISGTAEVVQDPTRFDDVFAKVQAIADKTGASPVPPISKLAVGPYEVFCIKPTDIRIARYARSEPGSPETIFDVVEQ